ncbi:hypothetical protein [Bacillus thuringiensis]|uniref:hypothetical protein n=1 Tax=Bacillus thuringiensis TaxID=1428 RepID=UPI0021D67485|nr:hypothetical protein [Bacillus thuringiensis]MCU7667521.1 hypothetical protein [Bacillus thuringiensis]
MAMNILGEKIKKVRCFKKGYTNLQQGKIYDAEAFSSMKLGANNHFARYRITDEEGDYYTVANGTADSLEKGWEWVE